MSISVRIEGLEALQAKLNRPFADAPVRKFMTASALLVEGRAKKKVKVDTGFLRQSITHEIDGAGLPKWARIGTNTKYGPYIEFGTRPHFPPVAAVAPWARRHGIEPFLVARAISRHGTKAQPFILPALNESEGQILGMVPGLAKAIEAAAVGG